MKTNVIPFRNPRAQETRMGIFEGVGSLVEKAPSNDEQSVVEGLGAALGYFQGRLLKRKSVDEPKEVKLDLDLRRGLIWGFDVALAEARKEGVGKATLARIQRGLNRYLRPGDVEQPPRYPKRKMTIAEISDGIENIQGPLLVAARDVENPHDRESGLAIILLGFLTTATRYAREHGDSKEQFQITVDTAWAKAEQTVAEEYWASKFRRDAKKP